MKRKMLAVSLLGILNALPFTFPALFFLSWFSLSLFFVLIYKTTCEESNKKRFFIYTLTFFFFYHFSIYYFFVALYPMTFVGFSKALSIVFILFAWISLSLFHALAIALPFFFVITLKKNRTLTIFSMGAIIVLMQYLLGLGKYGFPWARFSLPQIFSLPIVQSASLFGPYFIDVLLVLSNVFFALIIFSKKKTLLTVPLLIFTLNFIAGLFLLKSEPQIISTKTVTLVQPNILIGDKWTSDSSIRVNMNMTEKIESENTLILWGETAVPTDLNRSKLILKNLEEYTQKTNNDMLVGAFYLCDNEKEYNGAYYISDSKTSQNVYFKRKLVPFGEFLPARALLENVGFPDINMISTDLSPGNSSAIFKRDFGNVGVLICFDSIFESLARDSVTDGAQLFAVITNDSWYKDYPAVYQHLAQSRWRAVENGRYVARCANSGVSAFIDSKGRVISSLPPLTEGTLTEVVGLIDKKTLYTQIGDVIILVPIIFLIFFFVKEKGFRRIWRKH